MNRFFQTLAAAALLLANPAGLSAASRDIEFNDAAGKAWPTVNHAQASAAGARPADQRLRPALDFDSLIRNPATGWMLYDDALGDVAKADEYWKAMDEAARKYASIFYVRWRWAEAEPEEGRYAWLYDENFKALIAAPGSGTCGWPFGFMSIPRATSARPRRTMFAGPGPRG